MILLSRLGGPVFALNPDLIERAESTPDTVITLVGGNKYVVRESLTDLIALILDNRARVIATAEQLGAHGDFAASAAARRPRQVAEARSSGSDVVPLHPRES